MYKHVSIYIYYIQILCSCIVWNLYSYLCKISISIKFHSTTNPGIKTFIIHNLLLLLLLFEFLMLLYWWCCYCVGILIYIYIFDIYVYCQCCFFIFNKNRVLMVGWSDFDRISCAQVVSAQTHIYKHLYTNISI